MQWSAYRAHTLSLSLVCVFGSECLCLCMCVFERVWEKEEDWENQIAYSSHTDSLFTPQPVTAHFLPSSCLLPLLYRLSLPLPSSSLLSLKCKCKFKLALLAWQGFLYNITYRSVTAKFLLFFVSFNPSCLVHFSFYYLALCLSLSLSFSPSIPVPLLFSPHPSSSPLALSVLVYVLVSLAAALWWMALRGWALTGWDSALAHYHYLYHIHIHAGTHTYTHTSKDWYRVCSCVSAPMSIYN